MPGELIKREKENKIDEAVKKAKEDSLLQRQTSGNNTSAGVMKEQVNIKELSVVTSLSERTFFRLIKDKKVSKNESGETVSL